MSSFKIINGPMHGETLEPENNVDDGDFLRVYRVGCLFKVLDDTPMRYSCPTFVMKYHLIGAYAYYLGEKLVVDPTIEKAERILGPIVAG